MKLKHQSFYKLALFLIFVALVAASFVLTPRMGLEMTNRTVAQAIRYQDCYELINASGKKFNDVQEYFDFENGLLKNLRKDGINTVIVYDGTLQRLARTGAINLEIHDDVAIAKETHSTIFDEMVAGAQRRYGDKIKLAGEAPERRMYFYGNTKPVDLNNMKLQRAAQQLPFGVMTHEMQRFYKLGFNVILAPENIKGITTKDVDSFFVQQKNAGIPIYGMMPVRYDTFGGPELFKYVASRMGQQHLVLQEYFTQLGFFPNAGQIELAEERNYNVLRAYTIDYFEMVKLSYKDALRRWAIADDERNIRVNIIQPILSGKDLIDTNLAYVRDITKSVENRGFRIGLAKPLEIFFPNRILLIPIIAGIVAAFMLLCQSVFGWGYNRTLVLWGIVTGLGLLGNFVFGTVTHQIMGFLAAISFPVLSIYYITDMLDDIDDVPVVQLLANCAISLLLAVFFSLCGACLLAAILTDPRFLLEIDFYRGVKLTFILPLLLILIICLKKYDTLGYRKCVTWSDYCFQTKVLLRQCLTSRMLWKILLFIVFAGGILYIFIGRTGHSWQLPVPQFELNMRYWLEEHMYARPRAKEFLIGHIAFCLLVLVNHRSWSKIWRFMLVVGATIGQVSLVETFCHMRSPFLMSVVRALSGYAFGIVIGMIVVWIVLKVSETYSGNDGETET